MEDKFGDNGVVSVCIGRIDGNVCHMDLWLMSCRVLKRDMEFAMMDSLVCRCKAAGIVEIRGYYYPTQKNSMVKQFYETIGFEFVSELSEGTVWSFKVKDPYMRQNKYIQVEVEV